MGQTREQRVLKQMSGGAVQKQTPIATDMFLPNHSGIASHPEAIKTFLTIDDAETDYVPYTGANADVDLGSNDLTTTGEYSQTKSKLTAIGGFAIKLTNETGSNTVAGQTVKADTATNDAVVLTSASDVECFGVFLDSGVADGSEAWVVVSGIADVAMKDNTAATRGNWVETSDEAGYADATSASPAAAPQHFNEIGHCIESVSAGGAGTHILARCVLHFN